MIEPLSWKDLEKLQAEDIERVNDVNNSYTNLRLFGHKESDVKLIFYRDRHSWCPYCQKIWLWLEFKKIPYKVKKINMFCYGEKEKWFLRKVSSGKLPVIELGDNIITESDQIISFLENEYGPLGSSISSNNLSKIRQLEREIFRCWCEWLCRDSYLFSDNSYRKRKFTDSLHKLEKLLSFSKTGLIDPVYKNKSFIPGTGDIIFVPYMERINASTCYFKGFNLRSNYPFIDKWLCLFENQSEYIGTQGDFHTHAHDLPPQMGGCFKEKNNEQEYFSHQIDIGNGLGNLEYYKNNNLSYYSRFSLMRVIKHKNKIIKANPCEDNIFDFSLRCALTFLITKEVCKPNINSGSGLIYLRDRISVPRDMPLLSARLLRKSLNEISCLCDFSHVHEISFKNRYDQDPKQFI